MFYSVESFRFVKMISMSAPFKYTCPEIDDLQKRLRMAYRFSEDGYSVAEGEIKNMFYEIMDCLYRTWDELEDLRKANEGIRKWGEDMESKMEQANEYIQELESQINT